MAAGEADEQAQPLRTRARRLGRGANQWVWGHAGERQVTAVLDRLPRDLLVFHDLDLPGSNANVDHLVIGLGGIWAIDEQRYDHDVIRDTDSDLLWSGRHAMRETLRATADEASTLSDLIGHPVEPVMCVIAPSMPEAAFDCDDVRVCHPGALERQMLGSAGGPIDVVGAARAVTRVFGVRPEERNPPPPIPVGGTASSPSTPSRSPRPLVGGAITSVLTVGALGIAMFALVALATETVPSLTGLVHPDGDDASETVVAQMAPPPAAGVTVPSDPAGPVPASFEAPPPVAYVSRCREPGSGWDVDWVWPGDVPVGAAGYRLSTRGVDGSVTEQTRSVWTDPDDRPDAMRVDDTDIVVITELVDAAGASLATTEATFVAPAGTC